MACVCVCVWGVCVCVCVFVCVGGFGVFGGDGDGHRVYVVDVRHTAPAWAATRAHSHDGYPRAPPLQHHFIVNHLRNSSLPQLISFFAGFKYGVTRWLLGHTNVGVAWLFNVSTRGAGAGAEAEAGTGCVEGW